MPVPANLLLLLFSDLHSSYHCCYFYLCVEAVSLDLDLDFDFDLDFDSFDTLDH